jgi:RNA polymerase sigma-70 factor, ECF subfamily
MDNVRTSGDARVSVAELFEQHQGALRSYLRSATGSSAAADDLVQDVYLRVVQRVSSYESRGRERAWLFTIARRLVIDRFRRERKTSGLPELSRPATQALRVSLSEGLSQLSDHERDAFLFCELAGLTYAEIAEALGLSVDAVRSTLYRARLRLRDLVLVPPARNSPVNSGDGDDD